MCCGLALVSVDATVVNVALPAIQRDFGTSLAGLEWTVNAYALAMAVLLVTGGRMGDLFGRRRTFLIGVALFALSSMAIGAAPNTALLIGGRAVQGIGAALMMPATLALLMTTFPLAERGRAVGAWAGINGIAFAIGPVLGGLLTEHVSWRAVFYINVPIAIGAIAVTLLAAPEARDDVADRGIDLPGNLALTVGLGALVLAVIQAPEWGWGSPAVVALFLASVVSLALFVVIEQRVRVPMLDFGALGAPQFIGANLAGFAAFFAMLGVLVFLALYMQGQLGYDALQAGIRFLPATAMVAVAAPIAGKLVDRVQARFLIAAGLGFVAAGCFLLTFITPETGYGLLVPPMLLIGFGLGTTLPPMSVTALASVRRGKVASARECSR